MSVFLTGAVSSGTLRPLDLVFAFEAMMTQIAKSGDDVRWPVISGPASRALTEARRNDDGYFADAHEVDREELDDYLTALTDELDRLAPDGYSFGSNPGDAACYGFWETESDEPTYLGRPVLYRGGFPTRLDFSEDLVPQLVQLIDETGFDTEVLVLPISDAGYDPNDVVNWPTAQIVETTIGEASTSTRERSWAALALESQILTDQERREAA